MSKVIVMIHGWGTKSYNSNLDCEKVSEAVAWNQRQELVSLLKTRYLIRFFNLPGFCCVKEPKKRAFDLEDFSDCLDKWIKKEDVKPTAIVGYSFGGAVTLDYKVRYKSIFPIILISPALKRHESLKSSIGKFGKFIIPRKYFNLLKFVYKFIFNKYFREGTSFLRQSYDKIVRRDLRSHLKIVNPKEILLIYGDSDTSTPSKYISEIVEKNNFKCHFIKGGNHNIGETHPKEIFSTITNFLNKK